MSNLYYRGDTILLYVKFEDKDGKPAQSVVNPKVKVVHEKNGTIINDLLDTDLTSLSSSEYFYNLQIDSSADYGFREVIYSGEINGKLAQVVEGFHIIANSVYGENIVRVYGYVNQLRTGYPLIGTSVVIDNKTGDEIFSETFTKDDGSWEGYVYPGEYRITFTKFGFKNQFFDIQIGNEKTELRFDNVALESNSDVNKGNGIYIVSDKYLTKNGIPLNGLSVKVYSITNIAGDPVAADVTNDDGEWQVFLDPGMYFMKVDGNSMGNNFSYSFRIKVSDNGNSQIENISNNVAIPMDDHMVGQGSGSTIVTDTITDRNGNPIIDVQVTVFKPNDMNTIMAEDYTDVTGKWIVHLDSGNYVFEFYHPEFNIVSENRTV